MQDIQTVTAMVINSVSAIDVGTALGLKVGKDGRCPCPFHGGTHDNLKLYKGNGGYYCFVCHEYGNIIDLVRKYLNCGFFEAINWIDSEFCLGADLKQVSYKQRKRNAASKGLQCKKPSYEERYHRVAGGPEKC